MKLKRKAMAMLLALFMTLTPLFPAFAADGGETEIIVKPTFGQTDARSMLDMINTFRTGDEAFYWNETNTGYVTSKGEPLAYSYALEEIAMQRAAEVALSFSHTRPDGTSCFSAVASDGSTSWGENIAAGSSTASGAFKQWREDDDDYSGQGHRRNMLNPEYSAIGIGHVVLNGTHYWTQEFSFDTDSAPQTTPLDTERATSVTVSPARLASVGNVTVTPESVTVQAGERAALPVVSASVQLSGAWPGGSTTVDVSPAWTSADTSVCTVDGQEVSGVAVGSTTLSATVLGKTVSVSVTVGGGSGGGGGTGGDPEPADGVYAILYDDGTLVFQNGNKPESGKNVTKTYPVDLTGRYTYDKDTETVDMPWYNERESISTVNFLDKISPVSTAYWFFWCTNIRQVENIQNLDTSNVTNMERMFSGCSGLTALDVSHFDTANVTDMSSMFFSCKGLMVLDVSHFDTANVTHMSWMFEDCHNLTALDVSHFDTANVTDMSQMFRGCSSLTALDVSRFDTANVTDMSCMFDGCNALRALDVSHFDTANVTSIYYMFSGCSKLTALDVSHFDTANVTSISYMFYNCSGLTALDVSHFDTANVINMSHMFYGCSGLTALDVSHFDTANVTDMSGMFCYCSGLTTLDVSHFNTANVTDMYDMFYGCSGLTALDLSHFDTANATNMRLMFFNNSNMKTIWVSDKFTTAAVTESSYMFSSCTSLVGGNGTTYDEKNVDATYARIDTPSAPGYFTDKDAPAPVVYAITNATPDKSAGMLSVTLTNPDAATLAVSYFSASGQFLSVNLRSVQANAGSVEVGLLSNAKTARVMLYDNDCRPVCDPFEAKLG